MPTSSWDCCCESCSKQRMTDAVLSLQAKKSVSVLNRSFRFGTVPWYEHALKMRNAFEKYTRNICRGIDLETLRTMETRFERTANTEQVSPLEPSLDLYKGWIHVGSTTQKESDTRQRRIQSSSSPGRGLQPHGNKFVLKKIVCVCISNLNVHSYVL